MSYDAVSHALGISSGIVAQWSAAGEITGGVRWGDFRAKVGALRQVQALTDADKKYARRVEQMEYEVDRVFGMVVEKVGEQYHGGELNAKVEHVAQLAKARMQIQEFYQREVLAMRKAQERLAEVILKQKNRIDREVLLEIAEDLDRVFLETAKDAGDVAPVVSSRALTGGSRVVEEVVGG
jgi:hypothetical protein